LAVQNEAASPWLAEAETLQEQIEELQAALDAATHERDQQESHAVTLKGQLEALERQCANWCSRIDVAAAALVDALDTDASTLLRALHRLERLIYDTPLLANDEGSAATQWTRID
jgi:predicted  nucleic acid-binding Zn-ribbon protein